MYNELVLYFQTPYEESYTRTCLTPIDLFSHIPRTFQKKGIPHFSQVFDPPHSGVYMLLIKIKYFKVL